jgi:hypothetical protein
MRVEPSDSSYMPSLVVVSGGDTLSTLKELKTINIGMTDDTVVLLQDVNEVWLLFLGASQGNLKIPGLPLAVRISTSASD